MTLRSTKRGRRDVAEEEEEEEEKEEVGSGEKKRRCQSLLVRRSCPARARTQPLVPRKKGAASAEGAKKERRKGSGREAESDGSALRTVKRDAEGEQNGVGSQVRSDACRTTT